MLVINSNLEKIAIAHGDRLKVISTVRLRGLKDIIKDFQEREELNDFQKWIVNELYRFEPPEDDFKSNTIILVAIPHPFYAKVNFVREGKENTLLCLVRSDFNKTEAYLRKFAVENGYYIKPARNLPLKRLGVHSGLARYGRNNITYVDGLGSNFSYAAYFSNMMCEDDSWGKAKTAETCNNCSLCIRSCPTGAILKNRFLIDNQKCLSCINEVPGEFPAWIPVTAHHTLYDCLICQGVCPMNSRQVNNIIDNISFTEEETNMLLAGEPIDAFSNELKTKIYLLGIDEWYEAIPRNLKILLDRGVMSKNINFGFADI